MTGEIDEATILKMRQPRCGVSDKQTKSVDGPQNFVTVGEHSKESDLVNVERD